MIDVKLLADNNTLTYFHLSRAIVGANELFDCSLEQNRILFFQNLTRIRLMSMPHRSSVKFMGMRKKHHYLIWRDKNGFFSALDANGQFSTWSMVTGDVIFQQNMTDVTKKVKNYEIFRDNENDETWVAGYQNHENHTL